MLMVITHFPARGHSSCTERLSHSPLALQLLCPIPPKKHQELRLLHRSPKMCVIWRQGSQKYVILETIISFTSAQFFWGVGGWRAPPNWALSL